MKPEIPLVWISRVGVVSFVAYTSKTPYSIPVGTESKTDEEGENKLHILH